MVGVVSTPTSSKTGGAHDGGGAKNDKQDDVIIVDPSEGGKSKLDVSCGKEVGTLIPAKFGPGGSSRCIRHPMVPKKLLSPIEFSALAGKKSSWQICIKIDGVLFGKLLENKTYVRCEKDCTCNNCKEARENPTDLEYLIKTIYDSPEKKAKTENKRASKDPSSIKKALGSNNSTPKVGGVTPKLQTPSQPTVITLEDEFCSSPDPSPWKGHSGKSEASGKKPLKQGASSLPGSAIKSESLVKDNKKRMGSSNAEPTPGTTTATPVDPKKKQQQDIRNFFNKPTPNSIKSESEKKPASGKKRSRVSTGKSPQNSEAGNPEKMRRGSTGKAKTSATKAGGQSGDKQGQSKVKEEGQVLVKKPVTPVKIRFEGGEMARINSTDDLKKMREEEQSTSGGQKKAPLSPGKSAKSGADAKKNSEANGVDLTRVKTEPGLQLETSRLGKRKWAQTTTNNNPTTVVVKPEPLDPDSSEAVKSTTKLPTYANMIKRALAELNSVGGAGCTKLEILLYILRTYKPKDNIQNVTTKLFQVLELGLKKGMFLSSASCTPRKLKQSGGSSGKPSVVRNLSSQVEKSSKQAGKVKKERKSTDSQGKGKADSDKKSTGGEADKKLKEPLATICKCKKLNRKEALRRTWLYIKSKKLLDPKDKTRIVCDARLKKITGSKAITSKALQGHIRNFMEPL